MSSQILIHSKGGNIDYLPLPECLVKMLHKRAKGCGESDYIYPNSKGEKKDPRTLCWEVRRIAERAGLDFVTPHILRHTFATMMLRATGDLRSLQKMLRHKNISTTELYLHSSMDDLKAFVAANPLDK